MRASVAALMAGALTALAIFFAPPAGACDPGSYYDPDHRICQPSPPAYWPWGPSNTPAPPYPYPQNSQYPYFYSPG